MPLPHVSNTFDFYHCLSLMPFVAKLHTQLKRRGYFPMHKAAAAGAVESIEILLSAGLSAKTRDHSGRTPLHFAAVQGSAECVSFLCTVARSTLLSRDRATGDTPLHFAVRSRCCGKW